MAVITKDLGAVTAYAHAVAGGYTGTLEEFQTLLASYATVAQEAVDAAENAEAYAVGKRDGTDVDSGDEAYQNNAKYYADQALSSKTDAESAKSDAQTAQGLAAGSATSASNSVKDAEAYAKGTREGTAVVSGDAAYQNNAKYYAEQASGSASAASGSATSAAGDAEDAEAYAKGTRNGTDVGSSDPAYHNSASYHAGLASNSATSASNSATAAAGSASDAEAYAKGTRGGTAVGSSDSAYNKNAKYYAEQAEASATAAAGSAASLTVDSALSSSSTNPVQNKVVNAAVSGLLSQIQQKANIDGYYESMTVGNAEQLVATVGVEDNAPYNFRTAGGSADIGDRLVDKLVGGTVCWNQLMPNPADWHIQSNPSTIERNDTGCVLTAAGNVSAYNPAVQGTKTSTTVIGHKYWTYVEYMTPDNTSSTIPALYIATTAFATDSAYGTSLTGWNVYSKIRAATAAGYAISYVGLSNAITVVSVGDKVCFRNIKVVDLTQMFGSTIADYIYSLEQATAGAGVAWFKKLFPKGYYTYNPGELMSVQAASHKTVGFNQIDPSKYILGSGAKSHYNIPVGSTITQPVTPGASVSGSDPISVVISSNWGDAVFVSEKLVSGSQYEYKYVLTATPNCRQTMYLIDDNNVIVKVLRMPSNYDLNVAGTFIPDRDNLRLAICVAATAPETMTVTDLCLHLVWDGERDGEYEEYTEHVYPLDDSLTLRGIPKLDAANNLYYDGDTYESDGTVTREWSTIVYDGSSDEGWSLSSDYGYYATSRIPDAINVNYSSNNFRCDKIPIGEIVNDGTATGIGLIWGTIRVREATMRTLSEWKEYLANNPITVLYRLATPTTETADPFQNPQIVDDFGTEEYVDAGVTASTPTRDVAIPVGHETTYQANLRAKLEMAPDSPSDGDGDYIVRQTNGTNEYAKLVIPTELPTNPTTDGTYHLKATVSGGTTTLTWEADT